MKKSICYKVMFYQKMLQSIIYLFSKRDVMDNIKALSLSMLKEKGLRDFCVIDIRSKLAFASAHLKDSVHLPTLKDILLFLPPPPPPANISSR
ncbi:hypothetical protein [uncultured Helicobacter sp.]|uniref:hypothetical protein n=2 Tax=uncultured Helicobacter sp. TaxID=175537 RepID=UPI00260EB03C|nr:hypothetical protein [uncultured Helicobacter sp.]